MRYMLMHPDDNSVYCVAIYDMRFCPRMEKCHVNKTNILMNQVKKEQRQVNKIFCELKGGYIGIVEKAQETRFGMSPKYSRYIGIAS